MLAPLLAAVERELPLAVDLRHRLHADPELAHEERRTAAAVAAELPVPGVGVAGTGLIAWIGSPPARVHVRAPVAVRAELDGLPVKERTGAEFSARGQAMHACGHDVHMAALVALARAAHTIGSDALPAPLLAIFQPSEEAYPSGAEQVAAELVGDDRVGAGPAEGETAGGGPDRVGAGPAEGETAGGGPAGPDAGAVGLGRPRAIVGAHVHPELPCGAVALDPGVVNASCDHMLIEVHGRTAHGAYPHHGRDPILALAEVVVSLHAQVARRIDPLHPASVNVGVVEGGSAENVIPELARARISVRAYRPEDRLALRELVEQVAAGVAAAYGCSAVVELTTGEPALENDPAIVARARGLLGEAGLSLAPERRSCGSDDFAFFAALRAPLAMAFVGLDGASGFATKPLHHPELLPPDEAVGAVARALAVLYVAASA